MGTYNLTEKSTMPAEYEKIGKEYKVMSSDAHCRNNGKDSHWEFKSLQDQHFS